MKRLTLAAALAGLAFAGCAQSRSAKLPDGPEAQPVGLVPVPSIHDTINRGSNPSVARATLPDPSNPNWSGAPLISPRQSTGLAPNVASTDGRTGLVPTRDTSAVATRLGEPPRELPHSLTAAEEPVGAAPGLPPMIEAVPSADPTPAEAPPQMNLAPPVEAPPELEPAGDPLLGPDPQLMPDMRPAPASPPVAASPPVDTPSEPPASTLEPTPAPEPDPEPAPVGETPSASMSPAPRGDSAVQKVSSTSAPIGADVVDTNWKQATRAAARVGDEVITLGELVTAVKDTVRKQGGEVSRLSRDEKNLVAKHILNALIERSLMVQEAKHQLKSKDKQLLKIQEAADNVWRESELPPLLRQYGVENEQQLAQKLDEDRRSLGAMRQNFRQEFLAYAYMEQKLGRVEVALPEMLKFYEAHRDDKLNQRAPAIVWREILVDKRLHASADEARHKADALLDRLRRGEDFAAVAAAESEAPAKSKAAGGRMETGLSPMAVAAVNKALDTLPLNAVSDVIEGPESLHIIRVEERRAGGPATFAELQDSIRSTLRAQKGEARRKELVEGLRKKAVISTIFDGTDSDPNMVRR